MEDVEKITELISEMEREVLELKTRKNIAGLVHSYSYSFTPTDLNTKTITYASGSQPIITDVYTSGVAVLGTVSGNTQKLFNFSQDTAEVVLISTRPIESVA